MRLIRERDRRIKTGVPRSTWYALMAQGIAPKPVKLGPRSVAWIEDELEAWMRELETKRERSSWYWALGGLSVSFARVPHERILT